MMRTMHNHRKVVKSPCPYCEANDLDGVSELGDDSVPQRESKAPEEGDYTICVHCAGWSVFGKDLKLRKPTSEELSKAKSNTELWSLLRTAKEAVRVGKTQAYNDKFGTFLN